MHIRIYMEALLANEGAAGEVWELWNGGLLSDGQAISAWALIVTNRQPKTII